MPSPAVNIRELKTRLSHYLRMTKAGQVVEITERGRPIGRIIPISSSLEERIASMTQAGLVRWNRRKLQPRTPAARSRGGKTVADILVEGRR